MIIPAQAGAAATEENNLAVPWGRIERFIGQLTHDVRNGLNALELQLTFLGEISTDPEAIEEVKRIRGSLAEITRQLQAVKKSTGAVSLHPFEYPAADFFEDLQERLERSENPIKGRLQWLVEVDAASLSIDPELTMTALLELLGNASHFAGPDGPVIFEAKVGPSHVIVTLREPCSSPPRVDVADWGRTPLQSTRRAAYGLGLFRVRRTIEMQGGQYGVEYFGETQTFVSRITFPLAKLS